MDLDVSQQAKWSQNGHTPHFMYSLQLSVTMCSYLMFWTPLHLSPQADAMSDRNVHCIHNYGTQYYPDDGGSRFLQTLLCIYQTTRYHIPEHMKLQSLPIESKPHLALEILRIVNQNRTMENVQYMPLNTCHKTFNLYIYMSHKQYIKKYWNIILQTQRVHYTLWLTICVECHFAIRLV
jgi:hypothetical protein